MKINIKTNKVLLTQELKTNPIFSILSPLPYIRDFPSNIPRRSSLIVNNCRNTYQVPF